MTEEEWLAATDPNPLMRPPPATVTQRKRRLFVVACCRLVSDWLIDNRSREAVNVAEAFADGQASLGDLNRAENRAFRAAGVVGGDPARAVSWATDDDLTDQDLWQVARLVAQALGEQHGTEWKDTRKIQAALLRDIFGNPFRPVAFAPSWRTSTAVALAESVYTSRHFATMPVLADALEEAGCDQPDILAHCRGPGPHARGCWVVDLVLGKS